MSSSRSLPASLRGPRHLRLELLEARLALSVGVIQGTLWNDQTLDGVRSLTELGLAGRTVYLDQNQNNVLDAGEASTITDSAGRYQFAGLEPGTYHVAQVLPANWHQTWPHVGSRSVALADPQQTLFDFQRYMHFATRDIPAFREAGFVFDTNRTMPTEFHIFAPLLAANYGGSTALFAQFTPSTLSLRKEDGGAFTLLAMDLCELSVTSRAPTVVFTGLRPDGSTVVQSTTLDGTFGFETFAFTGFDNVVEVTWVSSSADDFHQVDNVRVQTAPHVATVDLGSMTSTLPALTVLDTTVQESSSGTSDAVFDLVLSRPHTAPLAVQYSFVSGDAGAGADYVPQSGARVTFLAGQTRTSATATVLGDVLVEPDEVFFLRVDIASGMRIVRSSAAATILDGEVVVNRPPQAADDSFSVAEDETLDVAAHAGVLTNDSDPDGSAVTAELVSGPEHGTLEFNADGSFRYTPHVNFFGQDAFTYLVSDGSLDSNVATVSLVVEPRNDAPVALPQVVHVGEDGEAAIVLAGSDIETPSETLTFRIVALPVQGALFHGGQRVHGGQTFVGPPTLVYRPAPGRDAPASDSFLFVVTDAGSPDPALTSPPAVVSIHVDPAVGAGQITLDAAGVLRIGGTAGDDRINVKARRVQGEQQLEVRLNGRRAGLFSLASVNEIRVWGRAGNDQLVIHPDVAKPALVSGGAGNDTLRGGAASDLLVGGSGKDWLAGRKGHDLLLGGAGEDRVRGNRGNDVVVGGEFLTPQAETELRALLSAWSSGASIDFTHLAHFDDAVDVVRGGRDRDLLFTSLGDSHDFRRRHGDVLRGHEQSAAPVDDEPDGAPILVVAADAGGGPHVRVLDAHTRSEKFSFYAYDPAFTGGVRVAVGDVNSDGVPDIVTAAGAGGGPHVRVFDGSSGAQLSGPLGSFYAYDPAFLGGVYLACADIDGDGFADIVTGAGAGGGPHVRVFSGATGGELDEPMGSFFAYGATFFGGVRVGTGDVNGDGTLDIITGPGPGGGPHVRAFSGADGSELASFYAFEPGYTGGVYVAGGNVDGLGADEIVVGEGVGGSRARIFTATGEQLREVQSAGVGEVRVAVGDLNADDRADVVLGRGPTPGVASNVQLIDLDIELPLEVFLSHGGFAGGNFVAGTALHADLVDAAFSDE